MKYTVCVGRVMMADTEQPKALRVVQRHVVSVADSIAIGRELVKGNGGGGMTEHEGHWWFALPAPPGTETMAYWIEENQDNAKGEDPLSESQSG